MSKIFGGSSNESTSSNQAFGTLNDSFGSNLGLTSDAASQIQALLGGDSTGFDTFKDATGFDFMAEQGSRGITGNSAASGLLRSGGTGKALASYGANIQDQYASQYLDRLLGLSNIGLQSGQLLASAGSQSESSGESKPGLGGLIGAGLSAVGAG